MICIGLGVFFMRRGEILCLEKVRYFFLVFFLSVSDFVFILLELLLGIL